MVGRTPRVFISYRHDSPEHSERVLNFAQALRGNGIEIELDQFHTDEIIDWPRWCNEHTSHEHSDFVLCVCNTEYRKCIEGKVPPETGKGAYWEGSLLDDDLYDANGNSRLIPILFGKEAKSSIPRFLGGWTHCRVSDFSLDDSGYEHLIRILTGQASVAKKPLGLIPVLPPKPEKRKHVASARPPQKVSPPLPQLKGSLSCLLGHSKEIYPINGNLWGCPGQNRRYSCLAVRYPYDAVKKFPQDAGRELERFLPLLPLASVEHTLIEGHTPLIRHKRLNIHLNITELYLKDEGRNPTGSFKDRKAVINANVAAACGTKCLHCVTSGNAGVATATYAGALGIESKHYLVNSRRGLKLERRRIERLGGEVFRDDAASEPVFKLPPGFSEYNCTPGYDPIGMEGYKVIAWEIWEQLDGHIPDAVVVPVGSGEGLVGIFKGFLELKKVGRVTNLPKMIAVEPTECGILAATKDILADPHEIGDPSVIWRSHADQLVLQFMPCVRMVLWAIQESHGEHCDVRNEEIEKALDLFINETGLLIEPSSAVVLAALQRGLDKLNLEADDTVVAILTGRGSEYANETLQFARGGKTRLVTTVPVGDSVYNIEGADLTDYKDILPLYNDLIKEGETTLSTRPIYVDDEAGFFSGLGERECVFVVRNAGSGQLHGYGLLLECRRDLGCSPHIAEVDTYFRLGVKLPGVEVKLLEEMLQHALSKGYGMAVHECRPKDDVTCYMNLGFVEKTRFDGFYQHGTTRDAILVLELASLRPSARKYGKRGR